MATMVAVEVLLMWPRGVDESVATVAEAGLWPVFVVVVGERTGAATSSAAPLFELLDSPRQGREMAVVTGRCQWSVVDARTALLRFTVRATAPVEFAMEIILPAQRVLGILDVVARGATIGITTRRHVASLTGKVDIRQALHRIVLLSCEPSTELAGLADLLSGADAHR